MVYEDISVYEVVGYMYEDGPVCVDCDIYYGLHSVRNEQPIFASDEDAEDQCVECGEWLLGEEPCRFSR